jgi:hypothetical protein
MTQPSVQERIGASQMDGGQPSLGALLGAKDYAGIIKQLDAQIQMSDQNTQAQLQQLMLNRGYFLSHLGLYRKALKVT